MSRKHSKRRASLRKVQSDKDKQEAMTLHCMANVRHDAEHVTLPLELFDLAAAYLTSLLHGGDIDYLLAMPLLESRESFRADVNFIRRTFMRAGVSCSSLIVCLWYMDQFVHQCGHRQAWLPRDLFLASMVVADKYLADVTWTNAEWAYCTGYRYTCESINELERRFLRDMNFCVFVSEESYFDFWRFLEFRVHLRPLLSEHGNRTLLSYNDLRALSQTLTPLYSRRLRLNLRPYEAIYLLAKTAASICLVYATTLAALVSASYIAYQTSLWAADFARVLVLAREPTPTPVHMLTPTDSWAPAFSNTTHPPSRILFPLLPLSS